MSIYSTIILPFVTNKHFKGRYTETMATPHSSSNAHPLFLASINDFHLNQLLTWWLHNWFYINVQTISGLDRRRLFTLAALSFWHIPITLWVLTNFLAQMEPQRCAKLTLYFPCRHHFTQRRPDCFQWGIRFRNQGLGTKVYSLLPGSDLGLKGWIDLGVCACTCAQRKFTPISPIPA